MKYKKAEHNNFSHLEKKLKNRLKKVITEQDLSAYRSMMAQISADMDIDPLDCAAAIAYLHQSAGYHGNQLAVNEVNAVNRAKIAAEPKMVRYRMEVGRKHRVAVDELKKMLVEETGVDIKNIGYIDIHNHYTLIKLPEGMPADIFNHLKSVKMNQQPLSIKRLGGKNKPIRSEKTQTQGRRRNAQSPAKTAALQESSVRTIIEPIKPS